ncbi:DUF262 domain-containing protein [Vibrio sp. Vb2853]|uniref:DUF262 domain-containing protein n=1 Tax=Vibrio TaxID=662 RepID=UPI001B8121B9|nr:MULTISPECIES: DUF262 domain-containing protein [Vibrio]ELB1496957.1 DUF262 domain-containing protein [Vibrio alginolyticus]MDW1612731.1 DUF262 domain-containing protein [Vibrio sp. Vb2881]MDW1617890.1 DUF262 domain-containing protein [Vibrio sp. Vb2864]MDW1690025.1 DUF262 domain-containing protein [Vibrio sp. Vb2853]MDW1708291.1 DUF262 domain-containing protein [Vibrio sp. Vb2865]
MINENLNIDARSIEDLFKWYQKEMLIVNRRYQRKLVWSLEEKRALISSIIEEYPIPLLLFVRLEEQREILDGMQRLEAIMSFISQKYDYEGCYFDLDATAFTKLAKDSELIEQKTPILSREISSKIASYKFPVSEYSSSEGNIDEVFRRINSNGKTLSKQELRSAGNVTNFTELVRKISIAIRGDASHSDTLKLNSMSSISINNDGLGYGVSIDDHFYVSNGVLTRASIRASADEELVANILGYIGLVEKPTSGSEQLDGFYGVKDTQHTSTQREALETFVQTKGEEALLDNFIFVYDQLVGLFSRTETNFNTHILGESKSSHECPRYFQAVFLAFYELIINDEQEIKDQEGLLNQLKDSGSRVIEVSDGGRWAASKRKDSVDNLKALILRYFDKSDRAKENHAWVTEIDNILTSSRTEQANYDFKQGFMSLDGKGTFQDSTLRTVLETCVGINNIGQKSEGFLLIGIAEKERDATRLADLYGVDSIEKNGFYITGIDHEAERLFGDLDTYFSAIKDKILKNYDITEGLTQQILKDVRLCQYKGKHLIKIEVKSIGEVCELEGSPYLRQGTSTVKVEGTKNLTALISNYLRGL